MTTPEILWKWQAGTIEEDFILAADIADDGTVILAGVTAGNWTGTNAGGEDSAAVKLSADGFEEWRWQEGTDEDDTITDIAVGEDGSAFLIGYSNGDWGGSSGGESDFAVAKISSSGTTLWRWQDGTSSWDYLYSGAMRSDGSVMVVGHTHGNWSGVNSGSKDFAAVTLDTDGNELWRWMDGTTVCDDAMDVHIEQDDAAIICGCTHGNFSGLNAGYTDMVVIKLSSDGDSLWTWQDGTSKTDTVMECALGSDGSIYLAGYTTGNWSGINSGEEDFALTKLDADGNEIWRWQDGTPEKDIIDAVVMTLDGSLFLAGYTYGTWTSDSAGDADFAIVQLHPDGTVLWRWQDGNSEHNVITAVASSAHKVIFGAAVVGDWEEDSAGYADFAAIMLESTGSDNSSNPTTSPAYSPTLTQEPSLLPSSMPIPGPSSAPTSMPIPGPSPLPSSVPVPGLSPAPSSNPSPGPSPLPSSVPVPGLSPAPSSNPSPGPYPRPSSMPTLEPSAPNSTPITTPIPTPSSPVSLVVVPPTHSSTQTPSPSSSGNTGSSVSPSSPSPSSTSSSNDSVAIIGGVVGAVIGVLIIGLIVVRLRRRARR